MDLVVSHWPRPNRADEAVAALEALMREAEANRALLLKFVLDGRRKFINACLREFRGMAVTEDMLSQVWFWLHFRRGPDPKAEFEHLCEAAYQRDLLRQAEQAALQNLHDNARRRMD
jgi:hypothetical protein